MKPEKVKLYNRIFKISFYVFLVSFIALYLSQATGYYEFELHKKMVLTEEKIKEFEADVAAGKNIDIENYLEVTAKDYSSSVSNLGYNISSTIGKYIKGGLDGMFKTLNKLVQE